MSQRSAGTRRPPGASGAPADPRRWLILGTVALAQLMVVLDATIVNIALPSAQRALGFSTVDRQWVVTAYALAFGSLLLFGGRLGDLIGRKVTFLAGVIGFAAASAVGGASASFVMLVAARAAQGAFGALLAPAALSILSTTFSDPKERGRAFGVYGAIVGAGGAIGLVLGGILTEYLSWRWCLYVNLIFAGLAGTGAALLLRRQPAGTRSRLDLPGVVLVSASMFCVVYGFSNAASHNWHTPSTCGFLAAGVALLAGFAFWQASAASPLLPPRVVADRNRARRLPGPARHRRGHVRHLPVPHLLPAADPGLLPGDQRRRLPADGRDGGRRRQPGQPGAAAAVRPPAAGHRRPAAGRRAAWWG